MAKSFSVYIFSNIIKNRPDPKYKDSHWKHNLYRDHIISTSVEDGIIHKIEPFGLAQAMSDGSKYHG